MTLTIYHLKTCDTCRKAIKAVQAAGHEPELIDVRSDGVPAVKLKAIADAVGWDVLLNTRSTTWRGLSDLDKSDMNSDKALALMGAHPTLIKRPVIDTGLEISVGWTKDVQAQFS